MKKIFDKKTILTIIITITICFGGMVVASAIYYATDVSYTPTDSSWKVSNVNDALNELYNEKDKNMSSAAYISDIMTQLYAETTTKKLQITLPAGTYWVQASINNYRNIPENELWSKLETSWNSTQIYNDDQYYHKAHGGIVTITQETTLIATYSAGGLNVINHIEAYTCILSAIKLS